MQYPFVIHPAIVLDEVIDLIYRKLEQAQALADISTLLSISHGDLDMMGRAASTISDLVGDLKQLFDVVTKKIG